MSLSIFLAQVIGVYLVITSLSALVKRKTFMQAIKHVARDSHIIFMIAALEIILGIILVVSHNVWDGTWHVVITVLAWLTLLEGVFYLFIKQSLIEKLFKWFARADWFYTLISLVGVVLGIYLVYQGFFV